MKIEWKKLCIQEVLINFPNRNDYGAINITADLRKKTG